MRQVDPRAMFVVDKATALIAAGGAYQGRTLEHAVEDVMVELESLHALFSSCPHCDGGDDDEGGNAPGSGSIN